MANEMSIVTSQFQGSPLTTFEYGGRPAWIAKQIGAVMGYGCDGRGLVDLMRKEWFGELIDGQDYRILSGQELKEFKSLSSVVGCYPTTKTNRYLMLLFESGLHIVCLKTGKPVGKKLRRFLADEVLPQLARKGNYIPAQKTSESVASAAAPQGYALSPAHVAVLAAREARLKAREDRAAARQQSKTIERMLQRLFDDGLLTKQEFGDFLIQSIETETGIGMTAIRSRALQGSKRMKTPEPEPEQWLSAIEVGHKIGVLPLRVRMAAEVLKLKGDVPGLCRSTRIEIPHSTNTAPVQQYTAKAAKVIKDYIAKK